MSAGSSHLNLAARASWQESDRIKRESRHIYNKLHSIGADSAFVRRVAQLFPDFLLTANLRCGAWYTEPELTSAVSYFKSTDGHTHQWAFSLKRSNLHLVPDILDAGGCIIVDSTRRGKSMPDALSKTIPVWCAVLNASSRRVHGCPADDSEANLVTPSWMVPPTEHDQIEGRLDSFVDSLISSDLSVPKLRLPLRPTFLTPQHDLDSLPSFVGRCIPVVLVSASRLIHQSCELAQSDDRFVYVQGAADDHENWARGLTPDLFWAHHDELLASPQDMIESVVDEKVRSAGNLANKHWFCPKHRSQNYQRRRTTLTDESDPMANDVEIGTTGVFIGRRNAGQGYTEEERSKFALIIRISGNAECELTGSEDDDRATQSKVMHLHMTPNKKGLTSIRTMFPPAIDRAYTALTTSESPSSVLVCCEDGRDLSGAFVVAVLTSCFNASRSLIRNAQQRRIHCNQLTKDDTKRRLQWLVSANPRANPGRAFLLRVNEVLLSGQYRQTVTEPSKDEAL